MPVFVYFIIGAILFGLVLIIAIAQVRKLGKFFLVYDNPDFETPPEKHSRNVMILAYLKYLGVLFIITFGLTINIMITVLVIPVWVFTIYFTTHFIRTWKYHKYSVVLFFIIALAVISVSFAVSPFINELIGEVQTLMGL
jgi:hypothetical protein